MLFHLLYPLSEQFPAFNVFRYITFRTASAVVTLGNDWTVKPTRELRDRLSQLLGDERYALQYPRVPLTH